jgi:hypothetical protein
MVAKTLSAWGDDQAKAIESADDIGRIIAKAKINLPHIIIIEIRTTTQDALVTTGINLPLMWGIHFVHTPFASIARHTEGTTLCLSVGIHADSDGLPKVCLARVGIGGRSG